MNDPYFQTVTTLRMLCGNTGRDRIRNDSIKRELG